MCVISKYWKYILIYKHHNNDHRWQTFSKKYHIGYIFFLGGSRKSWSTGLRRQEFLSMYYSPVLWATNYSLLSQASITFFQHALSGTCSIWHGFFLLSHDHKPRPSAFSTTLWITNNATILPLGVWLFRENVYFKNSDNLGTDIFEEEGP